jgi:septal ring factor EnvC (AmiA/AmiB activator)
MLYTRLTTEELERHVYVDPDNTEAKAELLSRVSELIDQENDDLKDAIDRAAQSEKDLDEKAEELSQLEDELGAQATKIEELEERIAELTHAEDLV